MATILNTTEQHHEIYEEFAEYFCESNQPMGLSFHNLIWQIIVNQVDADLTFALHPVDKIPNTFTVGKVLAGSDSFIDLSVYFCLDISYNKACSILDRLNEKLFGITPEQGERIVGDSMAKGLGS